MKRQEAILRDAILANHVRDLAWRMIGVSDMMKNHGGKNHKELKKHSDELLAAAATTAGWAKGIDGCSPKTSDVKG